MDNLAINSTGYRFAVSVTDSADSRLLGIIDDLGRTLPIVADGLLSWGAAWLSPGHLCEVRATVLRHSDSGSCDPIACAPVEWIDDSIGRRSAFYATLDLLVDHASQSRSRLVTIPPAFKSGLSLNNLQPDAFVRLGAGSVFGWVVPAGDNPRDRPPPILLSWGFDPFGLIDALRAR